MARIALIARDNGRGLSRDIQLLQAALASLGHEVHLLAVSGKSRLHQACQAWLACLCLCVRALREGRLRNWRYDIGITLEHVRPAWLGLSRRNFFIPNPEWLSARDARHLHHYEALLTKTASATAALAARGLPVRRIGFQSIDCLDPGVPRQPGFLHLAGGSRMKGTARLLETWSRHPEWPVLRVFQSEPTARAMPDVSACANIEYRAGTIADIAEIRRLQNAYCLHLCLSETEGWGHYIVEAMSCGAVVLTCDAPPMNELVGTDRGVLVAAHATQPLGLAMRYAFDAADLEAAVERLMAMDAAALAALGAAAREWYEQNQSGFVQRLSIALGV